VEFTGTAKLDRRTKRLVHRLGEGDVAIVDHTDLDRVTAEELLDTGVRVVVNVAESLSGRFPNPGPLLLVRGGVTLIDAPGAALFDEVSEGDELTVRGASLFRNGTCLARGRTRDERELERALAEQRGRVTDSPRTRSGTCAPRGACSRKGSTSRRSGRAFATGTRSSSPAGRDTSATCGWSGPTSATSSRCSWRWTAGRTR
jgi:hypothetical protein